MAVVPEIGGMRSVKGWLIGLLVLVGCGKEPQAPGPEFVACTEVEPQFEQGPTTLEHLRVDAFNAVDTLYGAYALTQAVSTYGDDGGEWTYVDAAGDTASGTYTLSMGRLRMEAWPGGEPILWSWQDDFCGYILTDLFDTFPENGGLLLRPT